VIFPTLNDFELEDPVKSSLQFLETLNQEDLAFRVFNRAGRAKANETINVPCINTITSIKVNTIIMYQGTTA
jgi:hypothetical protein